MVWKYLVVSFKKTLEDLYLILVHLIELFIIAFRFTPSKTNFSGFSGTLELFQFKNRNKHSS